MAGVMITDGRFAAKRAWGVENSGDNLQRTSGGRTVDVHIDNPAEELNYREFDRFPPHIPT